MRKMTFVSVLVAGALAARRVERVHGHAAVSAFLAFRVGKGGVEACPRRRLTVSVLDAVSR